jgi:hypothetical protein
MGTALLAARGVGHGQRDVGQDEEVVRTRGDAVGDYAADDAGRGVEPDAAGKVAGGVGDRVGGHVVGVR